MDKKALSNKFGKTTVPLEKPNDKKFIAQPKINLQSCKITPNSLKQRFKAFGRKPSLGAPGPLTHIKLDNATVDIHLLIHCYSLSISKT